MDCNISNNVWTQIYGFLSKVKNIHNKDENRIKQFVEGVWYILRTGCQWRFLPICYGSWRTVHKRFKAWADKGIWGDLMNCVSDIDLSIVMIDSTIVRAHACSAGYKKGGNEQEALGRSKGGFSTKIHAIVDAVGKPIKFILTGGNRNDITQAENLVEGMSNTTVLADKGYDSDQYVTALQNQGCKAVIPSRVSAKTPRELNKELYKKRHLIENFFSKIKWYRRVFSRYEKTRAAFLGFTEFASALICAR